MEVGSIRVAAYQAPLLPIGAPEGMGWVRERVRECEARGASILCCPEATLGGLADYAEDPLTIAVARDRLAAVFAPLASETVAVIVGFTELAKPASCTTRRWCSTAGRCRACIASGIRPSIDRSMPRAGRRQCSTSPGCGSGS